MRIAAVGDICCEAIHTGYWAQRLQGVNHEADVLLLAGNLTKGGTKEELAVLLGELATFTIPVVAVLGENDYEDGNATTIYDSLRRAGFNHLEGSSTEIDGVTFVGSMGVEVGFHGGVKRRWSYAERQLMTRFEHYLQSAGDARRVVLLHNSPILATVEGEEPDFLEEDGSSAMEQAIDQAGANLIVHARAAKGALEGTTQGGIPVYNVSLPLLEQHGMARPYRIFTV